jgi:hypothetical protein
MAAKWLTERNVLGATLIVSTIAVLAGWLSPWALDGELRTEIAAAQEELRLLPVRAAEHEARLRHRDMLRETWQTQHRENSASRTAQVLPLLARLVRQAGLNLQRLEPGSAESWTSGEWLPVNLQLAGKLPALERLLEELETQSTPVHVQALSAGDQQKLTDGATVRMTLSVRVFVSTEKSPGLAEFSAGHGLRTVDKRSQGRTADSRERPETR